MACHLFQKPFLQFLIPCTQIEHWKWFCSCAYKSMFDKSNIDFHYERFYNDWSINRTLILSWKVLHTFNDRSINRTLIFAMKSFTYIQWPIHKSNIDFCYEKFYMHSMTDPWFANRGALPWYGTARVPAPEHACAVYIQAHTYTRAYTYTAAPRSYTLCIILLAACGVGLANYFRMADSERSNLDL